MQNNDNFPRLLQSFFGQRLIAQRRVSPHTIASYRDTFRLLLHLAKKRLHKEPSQLELKDLNASLIGAFLDDLEKCRHNGARSRNLRLTAVRSFFRYAALETPEHVGLIQRVLALPNQRQPCLGGFPDLVGNRCVAGGAQPEHAVGLDAITLCSSLRRKPG
jgi:site-specific recombinase XerD